ncbi:MAG: YfcE family phosphodiesterase [Proteobacteria bacterium]|nr:YfcE family phosphodiesterase [Pseudomonadota bacterium]
MNILVISDIHGNYPALAAVGQAAAPFNCAHILNCGDSLVYAPFANQTFDWLQRNQVFSIRGNTDDRIIRLLKGKSLKKPTKPEKRIMYTSTAEALLPEHKKHLLRLKKKKILCLDHTCIGLYHGSPSDHEEFLTAATPDKRFKELAKETSCQVVLTGHSHSPFHRQVNGVHFINPGSVGRMMDGQPDAAFAILHLDNGQITASLHRCVYDVEAVVRALAEQQLPAIYGEMFWTGTKRLA